MPSSTHLVRSLPERRPDSSAGAAIAGAVGLIVLATLALVGVAEARHAVGQPIRRSSRCTASRSRRG